MKSQEIPTKFAPAKRSSREEIERQARLFRNPAILSDYANAVPNILLVLNKNRQVVHTNRIVFSRPSI